MTNYFGNRCEGCEHYDGTHDNDGKDTPVKCSISNGTPIRRGCSSFQPDITASCSRCFYINDKGRGFPTCKQGNRLTASNFPVSHCRDFAARDHEDNYRKSKKGGCFLSTAICTSQGLPDNCYELETLRNFRDHQLLTDPNTSGLVDDYYQQSPKLVYKLEDNLPFCNELYHSHILPIVSMIERNQDKSIIIQEYRKLFHLVKNY